MASVTEYKASCRSPYTYACDWILEALGGAPWSRAEASQWISEAARRIGIPKEELAIQIANQHIYYLSSIDKLETEKAVQFDHWRHIGGLKPRGE